MSHTTAISGNTPVPDEDKRRYWNRETSWLNFNERVLAQARRNDHPLLERVRFVSISASNLQEFLMVRVAGLLGQIEAGVTQRSDDGRTPKQQIALVDAKVRDIFAKQADTWRLLSQDLRHEGVHLETLESLTEAESAWLQDYIDNELMPVISPITVDSSHPFPFVRNLGRGVVVKLYRKHDKRSFSGLVTLPSQLPRFLTLPRADGQTTVRLIPIFEAIRQALPQLFPQLERQEYGEFQVVRDSDLDVAEEAEDLVRSFETALRRRQRGHVIRLIVHKKLSDSMIDFLCEQFKIKDREWVMPVGGLIDLTDVGELCKLDRPELLFGAFRARFPERIRHFDGDCFAAIANKDFVVHHPFESFDVVVQFLQQAAKDPAVLAIKQTLYRTSNDSEIISALCDAAEAGKSVTAVVELKARFDEAANIRWARRLEAAGVQVAYGFVDLKTHAKVSMVTRREQGSIVTYTHFGTGNYHPVTAKIYTDLSYFSANPAYARDAAKLFNYMTAYAEPVGLEKVFAAPLSLRDVISNHIRAEIDAAKSGRPSGIWLKMNALVDASIIELLYEASSAGVKIELVVRGICCLKAGLPGVSDNITVRSIIGRYLEHSRIYCFANGAEMPSRDASVYISSADLMPRNLNRRVETLVKIDNPTVHAQVLDQIMVSNLRDTAGAWLMTPSGDYIPLKDAHGHEPEDVTGFSSHQYFMTNPSLSGMGGTSAEEEALPLFFAHNES